MLPSEYLEKGWTQGAFARDCNGKMVETTSEDAVAWCMLGAIRAAGYNAFSGGKFVRQIGRTLGKYDDFVFSINHYNDNPKRTHDQVIAVMKQAEQELGVNNVT